MIIAAFAVFIMLTGVGVVGGTYYVSSVPEPGDLNLPESTTVYFSNGRDVMAKLGDETRYMLDYDEMIDPVKWAVISAEDRTFRTNEGIDFKGVLRAAWANFTGGEIQGASTITQQYARTAYDLQGVSYSRKLREAVMAWKLDDKYSKDEILEFYLNTVPFGRGAHGVEAAAQAFFGKSASKKAPEASQLTLAEAIVLVAMIKQPEPLPNDPENFPGYDPTRSPKAEQNSRERWNYILDGLVNPLKYVSQEDAGKLEYPKTVKKYDAKLAEKGLAKPTGQVVRHALSELTNSPDSPFHGRSWEEIRNGGYKIVTTVDTGAQRAAEEAADDTLKTSPMNPQPAYLQAALVGVQPGTGRVLAYFGGHNGAGSDYAHWYIDEEGDPTGFGAHPPGSSFKIYTAAASLAYGISLHSYWVSKSPTDFNGRKIRNASSCPTGKDQPCTLLNSIIASLNVPFYAVTEQISPGRVIEMARAAGVDSMWTDGRVRQDLTKIQSASEVTPSKFDTVVGIGQYPITVLDHANGAATFAANGLRAQAHFVMQVRKGEDMVYSERLPTGKEPRILNQAQANDLTYALSQVPTSRLTNGWDSARKTGTWEYNQSVTQNAHAWMVGFTKKLSAAVWVGNENEERAIKTRSGQNIYGSTLPGPIWRQFIQKATAAMKLDRRGTGFSPPSFVGEVDPAGSVPSPTPSEAPPVECQVPGLPSCPTDPPEGGGNGGGGGGGGGVPTTPPPAVVGARFALREPPGWAVSPRWA